MVLALILWQARMSKFKLRTVNCPSPGRRKDAFTKINSESRKKEVHVDRRKMYWVMQIAQREALK